MTGKIVLATTFPDGLRQRLGAYEVIGPSEAPPSGEGASVLVTIGTLRTDAATMDRLPDLRLICCYGTGYEGVDIAAAKERGIMVTHGHAANASAVADLAMALLLAANRRLVTADQFVRDGSWTKKLLGRMTLRPGLTGRRAGIFGFGAIGSRIAARAAAFEMQVAYHSRSRKDVPYAYHDTLQSLADWADFLMVAARADSSNWHAVSREVLHALGPDGIVVNISRGSIIDEAAMIELLKSGELGSAGLDVFEHEPSVPEELTGIPHVVLTPHIGGATDDAHIAMQDQVAANIRAFFAGEALVSPIAEMR
jgi:hydroxypyruvate reductase